MWIVRFASLIIKPKTTQRVPVLTAHVDYLSQFGYHSSQMLSARATDELLSGGVHCPDWSAIVSQLSTHYSHWWVDLTPADHNNSRSHWAVITN